jgi:outer membrane protein assembly factor BamB
MKPLGIGDPTAIASYRLLGVLGGGGMGKVYLGQSISGRHVAIKVIRGELAQDPVFRERFAREVAAAGKVSPLFSAAVVESDTTATNPWLATTFIDGPSLAQRVNAGGPLSPGSVLTLAAGLAEGLASIHQVGLVHRDLKPSNVLLDDSGPHIVDFGIARASDAARLTLSLVVGTPSYMPPERLRGKQASPAGDIFALGATLVFAATGHTLVGEDTVYAQAMQIIKGRFDLSGMPRQLRPFVVRCLDAEPRYRPTAIELARILVASGAAPPVPGWYGDSRDTDATVPRGIVRVPDTRLKRRGVLTLGGVAGLATAGLLRGDRMLAGRASFVTAAAPKPQPSVLATPSATPPPPPPPPERVAWRVPAPLRPPLARAVADRRGIIVATAPNEVRAANLTGKTLWARSLVSDPTQTRRSGDAVLVSGGGQLWSFAMTSGAQRFCIETAAAVPRFVAGSGRVFAQTGSSLLAVDSRGHRIWRIGGTLAKGVPLAASTKWLLTQDTTGIETRRATLRSTSSGALRWSTPFNLSTVGQPPGDGGDPGGSPPPPPGNDDAWTRVEAALDGTHALLREATHVRLLNLSDGRTLWEYVSPRPVVSAVLAGDLLIVGADRVTAHTAATGSILWEGAVRGARLAVSTALRLIVAAGEEAITVFGFDGVERWREPLTNVVPDTVSIDGDLVIVTLRPLPGAPAAPADVLALHLTPSA